LFDDFVIRTATTADRQAVLRIAAAGMQQFGLVPDFAGLDADLGRIGEEREGAIAELVAVVDSAVCGSVVISGKGGRMAKLSGFYVSAAHRGHGIGRALLRAAVDAARGTETERLYLETWGRMTAAVRLYESTGWMRGEDPPASSGADRSYWLDLNAPNEALPRGSGPRMSRTPNLRSDRLELRMLEADDADGRREERSEATPSFDEGSRPRARLGG
jgi:GNAT superfamily N-acetyltransferase